MSGMHIVKNGRHMVERLSAGVSRQPVEPLAVQIGVALGYTVVVLTVATPALRSLTDDFGITQAAITAVPVAAAWLAAIRWRAKTTRATAGRPSGARR